MYLFGLLLGHEPRLVDRRRRGNGDYLDDDKGDNATSTQFADESAGDTGSLLTAETPLDQIPVVHLSHSRDGRRTRRRSRSQAPPRRDRLSLWSRLMCQPEVFDPHVEASPMSYLADMHGPQAASPLAERRPRGGLTSVAAAAAVAGLRGRRAATAAGAYTGGESPSDEVMIVLSADALSASVCGGEVRMSEGHAATTLIKPSHSASMTTSSSTTTESDSPSEDPSSPVSSVEEFPVQVEEVGEEEPLDEDPSLLSVSMTGETVEKPRRAFRVTDTRKCRCRLPHSAVVTESILTANSSFDATYLLDSSSSGAGTMSHSGTTVTNGHTAQSTCTVGRLISQQELAVRRSQRKQQNKDAARRLREYNIAFAELVESQRCGYGGARKAGDGSLKADATAEEMSDSAGPGRGCRLSKSELIVVTAPLTNEALEALREHVEAPSYELPVDFFVRMGGLNSASTTTTVPPSFSPAATPATLAPDAGEKETNSPLKVETEQESVDTAAREGNSSFSGGQNDAAGCNSGNEGSFLSLENEGVHVTSPLPNVLGALLRCDEEDDGVALGGDGGSITPSKSTAAATAKRSRLAYTPEKASSCSANSRVDGETVQRIPRGRYALGSRGYVEHVMFAERRQQECALFTLMTEAHRQARAAHLRLSQTYYYYILPILAQYQMPDEVEGLVQSLLQCGSGTLRVFHTDFCKVVKINSMYDYMHCTYIPADLRRVQPVDYQFAQYCFETPWRELFNEIKSFLGMQAREDVSIATLSTSPLSEEAEMDVDGQRRLARMLMPGKGTVCLAATVLHSMELFERQRHTHMAIRDAEEWLAWYYYYVTPQLQAAPTAEVRAAVLRNIFAGSQATAQSNNSGADGIEKTATTVAAHPLEKEYLPMVWSRACETAKREEVLGYRRALKIEAMEKALRSLEAYKTARDTEKCNSNNATSIHSPETKQRQQQTSMKFVVAAVSVDTMVSQPATFDDSDVVFEESNTFSSSVVETQGESNASSDVPLSSLSSLAAASTTDSPTLATAEDKETNLKREKEEENVERKLLSVAQPLPRVFAEDAEEPRVEGFISEHTSPTTATTRVRTYTGRIKNGFVVANDGDEDAEEEEGNTVIDSYKTVNVGCFGLSFFSFFD